MGYDDDKPGPPSGNTAVTPTHPAALLSRSIGASGGAPRAAGEGVGLAGNRGAVTDPDVTGEWLPLMEKVCTTAATTIPVT